ncbi:hypothetical protein [Massilia timonae]|uniref:hypothetical protein n=1 Tax=Massilia timonae TaxID=47229 RepID=UPI00289ACBFD|nr:hypothetical protein [Massilia timonae]
MKITYISAGATSHRNDDHVAVFEHAGATDILVIDGGTSVTERDYLDRVHGDVTWFVHAFTAALEQELAPGRSQQECVHAAIDAVRARFEEIIGQDAMPLHAWPIAAMTWMRMLRARREFQNTQPAPTVLCLRPNGAFQARVRSLDLKPGTSLLIMTDGFYRLVDPYGRYTDRALVGACLERGLLAMLDELRTHESVSGGTGVRAVKAADDASAAIWTV